MSKTTNTTNIKDVIKEIKEYQAMQDEGKITYREVISKRFNSTAFKKDFADIYDEYTTKTSNMRFTCK